MNEHDHDHSGHGHAHSHDPAEAAAAPKSIALNPDARGDIETTPASGLEGSRARVAPKGKASTGAGLAESASILNHCATARH